MKHTAFIQEYNGRELEEKVIAWIAENEDRILEIIEIEYGQSEYIHFVTITYLD